MGDLNTSELSVGRALIDALPFFCTLRNLPDCARLEMLQTDFRREMGCSGSFASVRGRPQSCGGSSAAIFSSSSSEGSASSNYLRSDLVQSSTWSDTVRINLEKTGSTSDSVIQAKQVDKSEYDSGFVGSIVNGSSDNDIVRGLAGFD